MKCDACGAPVENGKCTYCGKVFQDKVTTVRSTKDEDGNSGSIVIDVINNTGTDSGFVPKQRAREKTWCIVLMWKYAKWSKPVKIIITLIFIAGLGSSSSEAAVNLSVLNSIPAIAQYVML